MATARPADLPVIELDTQFWQSGLAPTPPDRLCSASLGEMLGVNPWRDIEVRPMPDADGKQVDIHVRPGGARAFVYDKHRALTRELVLNEVLTRLRHIRDARANASVSAGSTCGTGH